MSSNEVKQYRIILQSKTSADNGKGDWVATWADAFTAFAEKWQVKGAEAVEHAKMGHHQVYVYRIVMMRTTRVTPDMRIKEYDFIDAEYKYLDIIGVENKYEQGEVLVTAKVAESMTS